MPEYHFLLHPTAYQEARAYLARLQSGARPGKFLAPLLPENLDWLTPESFLEKLLQTKRPRLFAESEVWGDGRDWNQDELSLLGDISAALPVTVYDDGRHTFPKVHSDPFPAHLIFVPGALLQARPGAAPADWHTVTREGRIDPDAYYALYERRLLPAFLYIDQLAASAGRPAFVTIPGIGCGMFAGPFRGQLGAHLQAALARLLEKHGRRFEHIRAVYFDPYSECENFRTEIHGIHFLVRPLRQGNQDKPQLCRPEQYQEPGDRFETCDLYSFVAWDHVSWPGNDFYAGARQTDDGVKAAATDSMAIMTGMGGKYDPAHFQYQPPKGYNTWEDVIQRKELQINVEENLQILPIGWH